MPELWYDANAMVKLGKAQSESLVKYELVVAEAKYELAMANAAANYEAAKAEAKYNITKTQKKYTNGGSVSDFRQKSYESDAEFLQRIDRFWQNKHGSCESNAEFLQRIDRFWQNKHDIKRYAWNMLKRL